EPPPQELQGRGADGEQARIQDPPQQYHLLGVTREVLATETTTRDLEGAAAPPVGGVGAEHADAEADRPDQVPAVETDPLQSPAISVQLFGRGGGRARLRELRPYCTLRRLSSGLWQRGGRGRKPGNTPCGHKSPRGRAPPWFPDRAGPLFH